MGRRAPSLVLLIPWLSLGLASCSPRAPETSVLLLSADSLRVDQLAPFDDHGAATPNLAWLARRGTLYGNAWTTAPWTAPAMVSVMTGLYPPSHGVVYRDDTTPPGLPTLPRLLDAQGHRLGNFSFFSEISYFRNLGLGPPVPNLRHDTVSESFRQWLGEGQREVPFFAWVHLLETHLPYGATGYRATQVQLPGSSGLEATQLNGTVPLGAVAFAPGDERQLRELYQIDVAAMDRAIGVVLDALVERGRLDDTLVVFVADHGEELLDHGWVGHASTAVHAKLVPEILRVPLILAGPGVPRNRVRDELVQSVDVLPTILRLLGLRLPPHLDGVPLPGLASSWTPPAPRRFAFFDSSPGGNLTPPEQRGQRLQGVTDGVCLLAAGLQGAHTLALSPTGRCDAATLRQALDYRRRQQGRQRLAILQSSTSETPPPDSAVIDRYAEAIRFQPPSRLSHTESGGLLALEWQGIGDSYWLEYRLGGDGALHGQFPLHQSAVTYGPVPAGFWNDLARYNPLRLRVADPAHQQRSPWVEVILEPTR